MRSEMNSLQRELVRKTARGTNKTIRLVKILLLILKIWDISDQWLEEPNQRRDQLVSDSHLTIKAKLLKTHEALLQLRVWRNRGRLSHNRRKPLHKKLPAIRISQLFKKWYNTITNTAGVHKISTQKAIGRSHRPELSWKWIQILWRKGWIKIREAILRHSSNQILSTRGSSINWQLTRRRHHSHTSPDSNLLTSSVNSKSLIWQETTLIKI